MPDAIDPEHLKTWRRARRDSSAESDELELTAATMAGMSHCGGPQYSAAEYRQLMREQWQETRDARWRAINEEALRLRAERQAELAEKEQRRREQEQDEEDGGQRAAERFRNDRYAVGLLSQDDSAWGGGGSAGSGVLG